MINRIAVYAVAHQDDWQLFMDPDISADIMDPACKVVILHTTAGDAGEGPAFWQAREEGAISSLLFRLSGQLPGPAEKHYVDIGGKRVFAVSVAHCSCYFLRLPDGGMHGDGFPAYGSQSMAKLRLGTIDRITTVDGANTFGGLPEIGHLVNQIIGGEMQRNPLAGKDSVTLNFPEFDGTLNPGDHSDHLHTALLLRHMARYQSLKKYAFVHYQTQHAAADLEGKLLFWKTGMFCVYHQTILDRYGYSTIDESPAYFVWCAKKTLRREVV